MSTEPERNQEWNKSSSLPLRLLLSQPCMVDIDECVLLSQPCMVNNDEFVVVPSKASTYNGDGIYKFNIHKNEWIKIFCYDTNFKCCIGSTAYDNQHKLLHISDRSRMVTFDLKTKNKVTSIGHQMERSQCIFVENKLHQICNVATPGNTIQNGDHYIYNKTKQFQKITTFKSSMNLDGYRTIYLKSKKSIFLFGGWNGGWTNTAGYQTSIYRFSCIDSKWKEFHIKMPMKLSHISVVATKNEQYIIILGGITSGYGCSDNIFIYDIRNNIFTKSKMKCPKKGSYHAITINNSKHDEIATFGFVNGCYKAANFVGVQILPHYLIKIIGCYFCHEEIHLLRRDSGEHWEINVDHILQQ
eukprot:29201_1